MARLTIFHSNRFQLGPYGVERCEALYVERHKVHRPRGEAVHVIQMTVSAAKHASLYIGESHLKRASYLSVVPLCTEQS